MTSQHPRGAAFLVSQIGSAATARFAERVADMGLTPPECGVLGLLSGRPGISQVELASTLRMIPSRIVALIDGLERAGLVERIRDEADRRRNNLGLTASGRTTLAAIGRISKAHDRDITGALDDQERAVLAQLLGRIADDLGLAPGVHPGFRTLP